jgi:hypothetical protein
MRHILDIVAIFLMGDGLSKLLSPRAHNLFYQASWAPEGYTRFLNRQVRHPSLAILLGATMVATGAMLTRWCERQA